MINEIQIKQQYAAYGASLLAQMVKNLPTMWKTWVQSLGLEDPLEKGMLTHSRILVWIIPWTGEPGGLQSLGLTETSGMTEQLRNMEHMISIV